MVGAPFRVERWDERERPAAFRTAVDAAFPPWLLHGDPASDEWWDRRIAAFPDCWVVLSDDDGPFATAWGVPLPWTGRLDDLPEGYTDSLRRAVLAHESGVAPTALVVCAAVVLPRRAREGLAGELLRVMCGLARAKGLEDALVPVRPPSKSRHPLVPIDAFAHWTRADGLPVDPWLRTHVRVGGRIIATAPHSQTLVGTRAQWEEWTGVPLSASGRHLVPGGLVPLELDVERDEGRMVEPNVWVRHP